MSHDARVRHDTASGVADVLVVGAGIVGAACAWELAQAGLTVTVVERGPVGGGATAEGMGHLVVLDDSPEQLALTRWSLELWDALAPSLPTTCEHQNNGTLWVAEDAEELAGLETKAAVLRRAGLTTHLLDATTLQQTEPNLKPGLPGALQVPGDAIVYPPTAAAELIDRARREHGARLLRGISIRRVTPQDSGDVVAETQHGDRLQARHVVLAGGQHALDPLPKAFRPAVGITPRKGHLMITGRHPGFCRHQLVEVGYLKSAHAPAEPADATEGPSSDFSVSDLPVSDFSVAFNLQPRPNGQLLLGSSRQLGNDQRPIDPPVLHAMAQRALDFVPGLARLPVIRTWTGFRAATPDNLPLLGPLPQAPGVILATGHEGLGITTSLASARLITDHLLDRPSPIPITPYLPSRRAPGATPDPIAAMPPELAPVPGAQRQPPTQSESLCHV